MIVGVGVDIVDISRFERQLALTPRLARRLFTPPERDLPVRSLAARFAGKEAIAKALGAPPGLSWQDVTIGRGDAGAPTVEVMGTVAHRLDHMGGGWIQLSLSHDGGMAIAFVIIDAGP